MQDLQHGRRPVPDRRPEDEAAVTEALVALGEKPFRVGECVEGSGKVVYSDER